jgi:hypothetical protein
VTSVRYLTKGQCVGCGIVQPSPNTRRALKAKLPKPDAAATVAKSLTAREKVALFCAAAGIDRAAVGILASVMQAMEIRGPISARVDAIRHDALGAGTDGFQGAPKRGPTLFRRRQQLV